MKTFELHEIENVTRLFPKAGFLVIGEMHGVNENAKIVEKILEAYSNTQDKLRIGFEWLLTTNEEDSLNKYLCSGVCPEKLPEFFKDSDGRVTTSYIELLQSIREINLHRKLPIKLTAFDSAEQDYEKAMAQKLKQGSDVGLTIVITGSVHARRNSTTKTFVDILSESHNVINIFLRYTKGTVEVEGEIFPVTESSEQSLGGEGHFDYEITVPEAHHDHQEKLLTRIQNFCRL